MAEQYILRLGHIKYCIGIGSRGMRTRTSLDVPDSTAEALRCVGSVVGRGYL